MPNTRPAPPYPADTRSKGWRFELDIDRMRNSKTWLRAKRNDVRAAAMMLWVSSFAQLPCGTLPNDDEELDLILGFPDGFFAEHRNVIMRGWYVASDGLLYHPVITERVLDMLERRMSEADRKAAWRAKKAAERAAAAATTPSGNPSALGLTLGSSEGTADASPVVIGKTENVPRVSHGTDMGRTTLELELELEVRDKQCSALLVANGVDDPKALATGKPAEAEPFVLNGHAYEPPACPHAEIIALWSEVMPELPKPMAWRGRRIEHLRSRWREAAAEKHWNTKAEGIAYFRKVFRYVRKSPWLMGQKKGGQGRTFTLELPWLVQPENFLKVIEGKYHEE